MYESGKLSLGQAADLAGLSKTAFSEILGSLSGMNKTFFYISSKYRITMTATIQMKND